MIVTLSRQIGSHGDEIAGRVAAELGLLLADREFIRGEAAAAGVAPDVLNRLMYEEQRSLAAEVLDSLRGASQPIRGCIPTAPNPLGAVFAPVLQLASVNLEEGAQAIAAIISAVADRDCVLFLGQGSQVLLRDRGAALHVKIVAPFEVRVARVAERERLSKRAAAQRVRANDSARRDYLARYHGANWLDPLLYHLVINTGLCSVADSVALIISAAQRRQRDAAAISVACAQSG